MTKKQYLKKVENCIQALPVEERNEALEYYSNYFDDADDDDKVMEELGEPEDLAKTIIANFTCVPAKTSKKKKAEKEEQEEVKTSFDNDFDYSQEKLYFEFSKSQVTNLGISLGAGHIVIKSGSDYQIETRGISEKDFRCEINEAGTLIVENRKFPANGRKYGHAFKNKWCPRILITVPENAELENFKLALGAGQMTSKTLKIKAEKTMIDVTAGNFVLSGITSQASNIKCAMGNVEVYGKLKGFTKIDCSMGSVKIKTPESQSSYSCDAKIGMGSVKFGEEKHNGFSQSINGEKKQNHFSINVGMGDVKIKFDE